MAKKKQPYIPLYTGDYIKDTRTLSLEAKGAWSDIILFMWEANSRGLLEGTMEDFARMVGTNEMKFVAVLNELCRKGICEVYGDQTKIFKIGCRRLIRESEISEIRSEAVQTRYKKSTKASTKNIQNPEVDIDNDNEVENELKNKESAKTFENVPQGTKDIDFTQPDIPGDEIIFPYDTSPMRELWARWKKYRWHQHGHRYGMMGEQAALKKLEGRPYQQIESTILNAIEAKWQNLYPEKANGKESGTNNSGNGKQQRNTSDLVQGWAQRHGNG